MVSRLAILFVFISITGFSQINQDYYFVEFTDKNESPYSVTEPEAYLSDAAIARRVKYDIAITQQDFPVNPQYVQAVDDIGVKVVQQTRWLNGIVIKTSDPAKLEEIEALPFSDSLTMYQQMGIKPPGT